MDAPWGDNRFYVKPLLPIVLKCNCPHFTRITVTTRGKYTALEAEAILPLVKLVDDPTSEVKLNALKVGHAEVTLNEVK